MTYASRRAQVTLPSTHPVGYIRAKIGSKLPEEQSVFLVSACTGITVTLIGWYWTCGFVAEQQNTSTAGILYFQATDNNLNWLSRTWQSLVPAYVQSLINEVFLSLHFPDSHLEWERCSREPSTHLCTESKPLSEIRRALMWQTMAQRRLSSLLWPLIKASASRLSFKLHRPLIPLIKGGDYNFWCSQEQEILEVVFYCTRSLKPSN